MSLQVVTLDSTSVLDLRDEADYRARFADRDVLLICHSQQAMAWTSWTPASVWMVLRGGLRFQSREFRMELGREELLVSEHGARVTAQAALGEAFWAVGLLLTPRTLRSVVGDAASADLMPAHYRNASTLNVGLTRLAHRVAVEIDGGKDALAGIAAFLDALIYRQREFESFIDRCPGRSLRHRRLVFLRLQRVRNYIEYNHATPMELSDLALLANMSRSHFLRLFHKVFGVTPLQQLTNVRMCLARNLIVGTRIGIADIAGRLGFVDRSSFARLFKRQFGVSATDMRSLSESAPAGAAAGRKRRTPAPVEFAVAG
jgi:AraC family transcriptional regulator